MDTKTSSGYDAPLSNPKDDILGRRAFASDIVEVILSTPTEWSARIGVFGKWGEGKTTVLRFVEEMLLQKGAVVFLFNPWAAQGWNDLWNEFGSRLTEALEKAHIPIDESLKGKGLRLGRKLGTSIQSKYVKGGADLLSSFYGADKLSNAAFGVLREALRYDSKQIKSITKKLRKRRLVVLVDDLDRCAPELIPQLLLALREIFDLPNFTFLAAFDDEIVAASLTGQHPEWKKGADFLDKILDFRFSLPSITDRQKKLLVTHEISRYASNVPRESIDGVLDLLPPNPRKLKALVRSFAAIQPQLERHDADEFTWVDMWLAQMIRLDSYAFIDRLLTGETLEKLAGPLYTLLKNKDQDSKNQDLQNLLDECHIDDAELRKRLVLLTEAVRARGTFRFRYACELALRPHALTWKEYRGLKDKWKADPQAHVISTWMQQQANHRHKPIEDVEKEVFETLISDRSSDLSSAADLELLEQYDKSIEDADDLLGMIEQYLTEPGKLTAERFRSLRGQIFQWIGFTKNLADRHLREKEEKCLLRILTLAPPSTCVELLESSISSHWPDVAGSEARNALQERSKDIIFPKAANECIEFLKKPDSVRSLTEPGKFSGIKYCLMRPASPIWSPDLRSFLLKTIEEGLHIGVVYENVRQLFAILEESPVVLAEVGKGRIDGAPVLDEEFLELVWRVVVSRPIQYRMLLRFANGRQHFIDAGVADSIFPLTTDLKQRLGEEGS